MEDLGAEVSGGLRLNMEFLVEEFRSHSLIVLSNDPEAIHFCELLDAMSDRLLFVVLVINLPICYTTNIIAMKTYRRWVF